MTLVYSLRQKLIDRPEYVAEVQARTLDNRALPGGLRGDYGLFGSEKWWKSIADGVAPVTRVEGVISRTYFEGQNNEGRGFEMRMSDGTTYAYSCVSNRRKDRRKYVTGKRCAVTYVTEPLKNPVPVTDGSFVKHGDNVLEIWIED